MSTVADADATTDAAGTDRPVRHEPPPGRLRRLWRGPGEDPLWARPALLGLLALTALLYLWDLSRNGYANDFYPAAVQAGSSSSARSTRRARAGCLAV